MTKKLSSCEIGEKVKVFSYQMNEHKAKRLMDMGLIPGTIIEITRLAPFGDPVAVKVKGFQMSFRRLEAEGLIVKNLNE